MSRGLSDAIRCEVCTKNESWQEQAKKRYEIRLDSADCAVRGGRVPVQFCMQAITSSERRVN